MGKQPGAHLLDGVLSLIGCTFLEGMDSVFLFLNIVDNAMSWSMYACSSEREQTLELGRLGLEPKEPLIAVWS